MSKEYFSVYKIHEDTYHIFDPAMVFCTLIVGKEKALLFDTCYGLGDLKAVVELITGLPIIVISSHGHIDHIGGNWQFDEVYLHKNEISTAEAHSSKTMKEQTVRYLKEQKLPPTFEQYYSFHDNFSMEEFLERKDVKYVDIEEGNVFELGERQLEVVVIPGHTAGSTALLDKQAKMLFAGDAVNPFLWMFLDESTLINTCIDSLNKVKKLDFQQIVASHLQQPLQKGVH